MLNFGQFRLRPIRFRPAGRSRIVRSRNWPKSKLIGRSRTDGVCSVSSFFLSFFFSFALFLFFLTFFLFLLISLFILFLFCFCFRLQPELNPKPRTPISDGPFRWTPPSVNEFSGCRVKPRRPHQTGPPGLAHDSPRTPNVDISGLRRFQHQIQRKDPKREKEERKLWREEGKKREILGLHPLGPHPSGLPTLRGPTFSKFGPPPFESPTLCRPKIHHPKIGGNRIGRSRNWPKSNWPNSKKRAAEVEIGRSRSRSWTRRPESLCSKVMQQKKKVKDLLQASKPVRAAKARSATPFTLVGYSMWMGKSSWKLTRKYFFYFTSKPATKTQNTDVPCWLAQLEAETKLPKQFGSGGTVSTLKKEQVGLAAFWEFAIWI